MKIHLKLSNNKYDYFIYILILSLAAGELGGALQLSRAMAIFLSLPLYKIIKGKKSKRKNIIKIEEFFLALIFYAVITLVWTPDFSNALKELIYYLVHMLFFLEILYFSRRSSNEKDILTNAWTLTFLLTSCVAVWEIITNHHVAISMEYNRLTRNYGNGQIVKATFAAVTFGNYNAYVTFIALIFPFLFYFSSRARNGIKIIFSYIPIVLAAMIIIINGSRGGALSLLISFSVYVFYRISSRKARNSFVIIIIGIIGVFSYYWNIMASFLSSKIGINVLFKDSERLGIWKSAWRVLKKYLFCGCGIGGMGKALEAENSPSIAAHNMFVEIGIQFGIVFLILLVAYIIKLLFIGKMSKDKNIKFFTYSFIFALPFSTLINSGYLTHPYIWASFASIIAVVTSNNYESRKVC